MFSSVNHQKTFLEQIVLLRHLAVYWQKLPEAFQAHGNYGGKMALVFRLRSIIQQRVLTHNQLLYYFVPKVYKITQKQFHSIIHFNVFRKLFTT